MRIPIIPPSYIILQLMHDRHTRTVECPTTFLHVSNIKVIDPLNKNTSLFSILSSPLLFTPIHQLQLIPITTNNIHCLGWKLHKI
jgi:hypothetical protein